MLKSLRTTAFNYTGQIFSPLRRIALDTRGTIVAFFTQDSEWIKPAVNFIVAGACILLLLDSIMLQHWWIAIGTFYLTWVFIHVGRRMLLHLLRQVRESAEKQALYEERVNFHADSIRWCDSTLEKYSDMTTRDFLRSYRQKHEDALSALKLPAKK